MHSATPFLVSLRHAMLQVRAGTQSVSSFIAEARAQKMLLHALPERYSELWLGLLDRLESSALFSEESCSFSQTELLSSLEMWLDKAQQLLDTNV